MFLLFLFISLIFILMPSERTIAGIINKELLTTLASIKYDQAMMNCMLSFSSCLDLN